LVFSTNDVLANLGVIVGAILVRWTGSSWPDLVVGTVIAVLVFTGAVRILRLRYDDVVHAFGHARLKTGPALRDLADSGIPVRLTNRHSSSRRAGGLGGPRVGHQAVRVPRRAMHLSSIDGSNFGASFVISCGMDGGRGSRRLISGNSYRDSE